MDQQSVKALWILKAMKYKLISEDGVDLSAEAKLIFFDGSKAYLNSSIKENLNNSVEVTDGKNTLIIKDSWHCGEYQKAAIT